MDTRYKSHEVGASSPQAIAATATVPAGIKSESSRTAT